MKKIKNRDKPCTQLVVASYSLPEGMSQYKINVDLAKYDAGGFFSKRYKEITDMPGFYWAVVRGCQYEFKPYFERERELYNENRDEVTLKLMYLFRDYKEIERVGEVRRIIIGPNNGEPLVIFEILGETSSDIEKKIEIIESSNFMGKLNEIREREKMIVGINVTVYETVYPLSINVTDTIRRENIDIKIKTYEAVKKGTLEEELHNIFGKL